MLPPRDAIIQTQSTETLASDIRHRLPFGPSYLLPGKEGFCQMLQGWQVTSTVSIFSGRPMNPTDATDDLSGTGEGAGSLDARWQSP